MNRSGRAVAALLDRYGLEPADLLVVYDDLALPVGALRLRGKGSHGGHNGIRDLIEALGSTEFPRLRVGVGNSFRPGGQVDFVLSPFDDEERGGGRGRPRRRGRGRAHLRARRADGRHEPAQPPLERRRPRRPR